MRLPFEIKTDIKGTNHFFPFFLSLLNSLLFFYLIAAYITKLKVSMKLDAVIETHTWKGADINHLVRKNSDGPLDL